MIKFLAFLLILCILFGVATTRALVFGTFGIIILAVLGLFAVCFLIYAYDALRDKRTPEQKAKDKEIEKKKNKEAMATNKRALVFWCKMMIALFVPIALICFLLVFLLKK